MGIRGTLESERRYAEEAGRLRSELAAAQSKVSKHDDALRVAWWKGFDAALWIVLGLFVFVLLLKHFWLDVTFRVWMWWP